MSDADRRTAISRETAETTIDMTLAIDGDGDAVVDAGIGFFDRVLEAFTKHGLFNPAVQCGDDFHIGDHHTIEDMAIVLSKALTEALSDKHGVVRYTDRRVPLDETVTSVVADVSSRPFSEFPDDFSQPYIGGFTSRMAEHFTMSLTMSAGLALHADIEGDNAHHGVEALFRALAHSLDDTTRVDPRRSNAPSIKGKL